MTLPDPGFEWSDWLADLGVWFSLILSPLLILSISFEFIRVLASLASRLMRSS